MSILMQTNFMHGKKTLAPFNIVADSVKVITGQNINYQEWDSPYTDFVGSNGVAAFSYIAPNGQRFLNTGSRTKPLLFDPTKNYYFEIHAITASSSAYGPVVTAIF